MEYPQGTVIDPILSCLYSSQMLLLKRYSYCEFDIYMFIIIIVFKKPFIVTFTCMLYVSLSRAIVCMYVNLFVDLSQ